MRIFLLLSLGFAFPIYAMADGSSGSSVRGGGDEVGIEFQQVMATALKEAGNMGLPVDMPQLEQIAAQAKVLVVDTPLFVESAGLRQDSIAVNDRSDQTIQINRSRWKMIQSRSMKEGIALHELLSLAGLESTGQYPFTSRYMASFGLKASRFGVDWQEASLRAEGLTSISTTSCRMETTLQAMVDESIHELTMDELSIEATWQIGEKKYSLANMLPQEDEMWTRISMAQSQWTKTPVEGQAGSWVINSKIRALTVQPTGKFVMQNLEGAVLYEQIEPQKIRSTRMLDNQRTEEIETATSETLLDGTENTRSVGVPRFDAANNVRILRLARDCSKKPLAYRWVEAWGNPKFKERVEAFSKVVSIAARNEVALKDCEKSGQADCGMERVTLAKTMENLDLVWSTLIKVPVQPKPTPAKPRHRVTRPRNGTSPSDRIDPEARRRLDETLENLKREAERSDYERLKREVEDLRRRSRGFGGRY